MAKNVKTPVAAAASSMATIADEARTQVTKGESAVSLTASVVPALRDKGHALASLVLKELDKHGSSWTRFYQDLLQLAPEGRQQFRKDLEQVVKDRNAAIRVPGLAGEPVEDKLTSRSVNRSQLARLSEFITISRALDSQVELRPDFAFSVAVGWARTGLRAAAAAERAKGGTGDQASNRGAKPKTLEEKLITLLIADKSVIGSDKKVNFIRDLGEEQFLETCKAAIKAFKDAEAIAATEKTQAEDITKLMQKSLKATPPARKGRATPAKTKGKTLTGEAAQRAAAKAK